MAIFDLTFDLTWCRRIKAVQSHDVFERLWHKRSKVCKAVVSLNAFNARQTGVKVTDMFDLAFDRDQKHGKPIRYLIPPLTCVKGGVKVKITFALFFVKDQMYRQSHNIFETHLTLVKVWIKAMIIFDLHFDQDQIQRKSNFSCRFVVIASGRWLGVRLDVIMSFFVGTVALAAVLGSQDAGRYIIFTQFCVLWQRNHFPSHWVVFVLKYKNKAHKNMDTKPRVVCQLNKLLTSRLKDDDLNK